MVAAGLPVQQARRVLEVSESGYGRRRRSGTCGQIAAIHAASHGTYGARRVHAELTVGQGIIVGHGTAELLMRQARDQGPARHLGTQLRSDAGGVVASSGAEQPEERNADDRDAELRTARLSLPQVLVPTAADAT
jgi:HTH-like domain